MTTRGMRLVSGPEFMITEIASFFQNMKLMQPSVYVGFWYQFDFLPAPEYGISIPAYAKRRHFKRKSRSYSLFQNNITFKPQDNSVFIGKNSQIKPRKSEQGIGG
jgi:hypothetical protein